MSIRTVLVFLFFLAAQVSFANVLGTWTIRAAEGPGGNAPIDGAGVAVEVLIGPRYVPGAMPGQGSGDCAVAPLAPNPASPCLLMFSGVLTANDIGTPIPITSITNTNFASIASRLTDGVDDQLEFIYDPFQTTSPGFPFAELPGTGYGDYESARFGLPNGTDFKGAKITDLQLTLQVLCSSGNCGLPGFPGTWADSFVATVDVDGTYAVAPETSMFPLSGLGLLALVIVRFAMRRDRVRPALASH